MGSLTRHMLKLLTFKFKLIPGDSLCSICNRFNNVSFIALNTFVFKRCVASQHVMCRQTDVTFHKNKKLCTIPVLQGAAITSAENPDVITSADLSLLKENEKDVLEPCQEDVSDIGPFVSPSYNLAAYVNTSHTLQQFVKMGVELHKVEIKKGAAECILKLDFEKHVKPHLRFLHDNGVPAEEFGRFVTNNPFIFNEIIDDLQVRVNYLEAKKFSKDAISRIITKNPLWLNFSTIEIDKRLGFFQRSFILSGDEVRMLVAKRPTLITFDLGKLTVARFAVKEEMGFNELETKTLLLKAPKLFHIKTKSLKSRFDYVHNIMGISHDQLLQQPSILLFRDYIVKQRHEFLKELGKAQYDPKLPNYVSLENLVHGSDVDFCRNVANTSIDVFNAYLKTC